MKFIHSQFKVISVSSNTNSFGLHGVIIGDKSGLAFEVGMNSLSKPGQGDTLNVTLTETLQLVGINGRSYEIPRKLPALPKNVIDELFPEQSVSEPVIQAKTSRLGKPGQWNFYIETDSDIRKNLFIRDCKKPKRTQLWKDMQLWLTEQPFADFKVKSVGYELINNSNLILCITIITSLNVLIQALT